MEQSVVDGRGARPRGSRPARQHQREHSRYDQALGAAKNSGKRVRFTLLQEAEFLDDDCELECVIVQIDKFDIEVIPTGWAPDSSLWIKKSSIMATRILL